MASKAQQAVFCGSSVRQNFHPECEAGINKHMAIELEAMYSYLAMANFFKRHNESLGGLAGFFSTLMQNELDHVELLSKYQCMRGGKVSYSDIKPPSRTKWASGESELAVDAVGCECIDLCE